MDNIKSILFVCTGNSCRSIMAEGLMKKYLKALGKDNIEVVSAGVGAIDGFPPTEETIETMKKEGVDVSGYRSKKITQEMIKSADLILVMEAPHKDIVARFVPGAAPKTYLLKEFLVEKLDKNYPDSHNIPDPIGRPMDYYKLSFEIIKNQIERIAKLL